MSHCINVTFNVRDNLWGFDQQRTENEFKLNLVLKKLFCGLWGAAPHVNKSQNCMFSLNAKISVFELEMFSFGFRRSQELHVNLPHYKTVTLAAYTKNEHESTEMFPGLQLHA